MLPEPSISDYEILPLPAALAKIILPEESVFPKGIFSTVDAIQTFQAKFSHAAHLPDQHSKCALQTQCTFLILVDLK